MLPLMFSVATVVRCCFPLRSRRGLNTFSGSSASCIRRPASILTCSVAEETAPATSVTTTAGMADGLLWGCVAALQEADAATVAAVSVTVAGIMHATRSIGCMCWRELEALVNLRRSDVCAGES